MVPVLLIFAFTGNQLGNIESFSLAAVFSPGLLVALGLLASFPFLARALVGLTRRYRQKRGLVDE
jgi:ABC-type sulfate transport system permease subunit